MEIQLEPIDNTYLPPLEWEKINFQNSVHWMDQNWHFSILFSAIYIFLIHWGQWVMKDRAPLKLRKLLFFWNMALAVFSIVGFIRSFPEVYTILTEPNGVHRSICSRDHQTISTAFWSLMSAWSKVAELFDTAFVVLRKQPLIFLHWYHHTTVLLFTWFTYSSLDPSNRWFLTMNYFIHGIMYTYYGLRAVGIRLPRQISVSITTMQILQMVVGVYINVHTILSPNEQCARLPINVTLALLMYFSYMILFAKFFYNAYVVKSSRKKAD